MLTSASGNHNKNCARAVGHVCRCTGCFGSLHGWEGWTILANAVASKRQSRREKVDAEWDRNYRPGRKRVNGRSKAASTDLARLDIADWLANEKVSPHIVVPEQRRLPDGTITGSRIERERNEQPSEPSSDSTESSESQLEQAESGDGRDKHNQPELQTKGSEHDELDDVPLVPLKVDHVMTWSDPGESLSGRVRTGVGSKDHGQHEGPSERSERSEPDDGLLRPSAIEQVTTFAEAMTQSIWKEIATELGDTKKAREIKLQLAHHGWCDLFIGLAKAVKKYQDFLDRIPEGAKEIVKWAILGSSMQPERPAVTRAVVDIVVDRVWQAFKTATFAHYPLLSVLDSEEVLRSLRILAVFTCPAPENHKEVCEYALKPLGDDAMKVLTEQTKKRLAKVFEEWATGGNESASADLATARL